MASFWRESAEGSAPEKVAEGCGFAFDTAPDGQYLLSLIAGGDKTGIYEYSLAEQKCTSLLPGVVTFGLLFDPAGKSFLYAVPSCRDVTIYRQKWQAGRLMGQPEVALKLPFCFSSCERGQCIGFYARAFHRRLCAARRARRPLSSQPKMAQLLDTAYRAAAHSVNIYLEGKQSTCRTKRRGGSFFSR